MVWERIKEIKNEKARKQRDDEAESIRRQQEAEADATQRRIADDEKRRQEADQAREITTRIMSETGLAEGMRELYGGLKGTVRRSALVVDSTGNLMLVWGSRFAIKKDGSIGFERLLFGPGLKDYSCISASVSVKDEAISINRTTLKREQWQSDAALVQNVLANTYLNPDRVNDDDRPSTYSSSSSSTECCNQ